MAVTAREMCRDCGRRRAESNCHYCGGAFCLDCLNWAGDDECGEVLCCDECYKAGDESPAEVRGEPKEKNDE